MPGVPGRSGRKPKLRPAALRADPDALRNVDPPIWMEGPARDLWLTLAPLLCQRGILRATDIPGLEVFCSAYGRFRVAEREIAERGLLVAGAAGGLVKNPAVSIAGQAVQQLATFGAMLGLDPASRQRLLGTAPRSGDNNPFARLLDG